MHMYVHTLQPFARNIGGPIDILQNKISMVIMMMIIIFVCDIHV